VFTWYKNKRKKNASTANQLYSHLGLVLVFTVPVMVGQPTVIQTMPATYPMQGAQVITSYPVQGAQGITSYPAQGAQVVMTNPVQGSIEKSGYEVLK